MTCRDIDAVILLTMRYKDVNTVDWTGAMIFSLRINVQILKYSDYKAGLVL